MGLTFVLRSEDPRVSPADLSTMAVAMRIDQPAFAAAMGFAPANVITDGVSQAVPPDAIIARIVPAAQMDEPGAEAYHSVDAQGHPTVLIGTFALDSPGGGVLKGTSPDGDAVSIGVDHEIKETVADMSVDLWADRFDGLTEVAFEIVDPFQGGHYELSGMWLADYALRTWFDPSTPAGTKVNATGTATTPLVLGVGGYQVLRHISAETSTEWGKHRAARLAAKCPEPSPFEPWIDFDAAVPEHVRQRVRRRASHRIVKHAARRARAIAALKAAIASK